MLFKKMLVTSNWKYRAKTHRLKQAKRLELPLPITNAKISLLMGLDWMQLLGITRNSTTDKIEIQSIELD